MYINTNKKVYVCFVCLEKKLLIQYREMDYYKYMHQIVKQQFASTAAAINYNDVHPQLF